jgi:hypothetical protein
MSRQAPQPMEAASDGGWAGPQGAGTGSIRFQDGCAMRAWFYFVSACNALSSANLYPPLPCTAAGHHGHQPDRLAGPCSHPPRPHRPQDRVPAARPEDEEAHLPDPHGAHDAGRRRQHRGVRDGQGGCCLAAASHRRVLSWGARACCFVRQSGLFGGWSAMSTAMLRSTCRTS